MKKHLPKARRTSSPPREAGEQPRAATATEVKRWHGLPVVAPMSLRPALDSIDKGESLPRFIKVLRELINSDELADPQKAPGHLARLVESTVWRFELLVRSGALDDVMPRLSALPILYAPENGAGASRWKQAKQLFEVKRVGQDSFTKHHGLEPKLARRLDYGVAAAQTARLLWQASLELPAFDAIRARANAKWVQSLRRDAKSEPFYVTWYHCSDCVLRWPSWLDLCRQLPGRRTAAATKYRTAAKGMLSEFFATPHNEIAEKMAGVRSDDQSYPAAVAEAKRRILMALDRL